MTNPKRLFQEPDPLLKAEITAGHGPNGTKVHHIYTVAVVNWSAREDINPGNISTVNYTELTSFCDLAQESNTIMMEGKLKPSQKI